MTSHLRAAPLHAALRACAIVPSYNHHRALPAVLARLRQAGLPVFLIDDGSSEPAAAVIAGLHAPDKQIIVHRLDTNQGKGRAVVCGFHLAINAGFTHAVQVDADGQHDLDALPDLIAAAASYPEAVISGAPVYDRSIPTGRKIGRWITHIWVFIETLSFRITDSMCGFRVYPLAAVADLLAREHIGQRMEFDTDIIVRLFWRGVAPVMIPVRVTYPADNTSNFDLVRDNVRISRMHARLFFTMLWRLPFLLVHRPPQTGGQIKNNTPPQTGGRIENDTRPRDGRHWAGLAERGVMLGLRVITMAYRLLGRRGCLAVLAPISLYFYWTGREQRQASLAFLRRALPRPVRCFDGYRHFMSFAARAVDTFAGWAGAIPSEAIVVADPQTFDRAASTSRGAVLIVSHHGNVELARALMAPALRARLTILVHTRHAENYNRIVREVCPDAAIRQFEVTDIGPDTAIRLKECVDRGEWVAVAGDRIPVLSTGRVSRVPFLGAPAAFSQGPWLLAALLACPVYLLFCRRLSNGHWRLSFELFSDGVDLPRGNREAALEDLTAAYALRLEQECRHAPFQWYNFFDFWADGTNS